MDHTRHPWFDSRRAGVTVPSSVTSVFSEAEDFTAALRAEGCLSLLVTGAGQFQARLTQVALLGLRLSATDEQCRGSPLSPYRPTRSLFR
jgi:hypothetical protein